MNMNRGMRRGSNYLLVVVRERSFVCLGVRLWQHLSFSRFFIITIFLNVCLYQFKGGQWFETVTSKFCVLINGVKVLLRGGIQTPGKMPKRQNQNSGDEPAGSANKRARIVPGNASTTENPQPSCGLKNTLHGNVFQLKLLMLFLIRGISAGYQFKL